MSKLDRQLDDVMGEERVQIRLAEGEAVDVGGLHQLLRNEIDSREHRVPLDLRGVHGAPQALVDVLIESQRYAQAKGKRLSISYALPQMRDALNPRRRTNSRELDDVVIAADAGSVAKSLLDQHHADETLTYDVGRSERIQRDTPPRTGRDRSPQRGKVRCGRDYAILGAVVLVIASVIGAIEWVIVFNHSPNIVIPNKTFEMTSPQNGP